MQKSNIPFRQRFSLQDRKASFQSQMAGKQDKIALIVEKHPKSSLPSIQKTKFICQKTHRFMAIQNMISQKVDEARDSDKHKKLPTHSFYMYINNKHTPAPDSQMVDIYLKYKDQDGYLYLSYGEMESFGGQI